MIPQTTLVLIPSHGLEDLPTDLGERDAASLLNAFAIAWHPALLHSANALPGWYRADDPPDCSENTLVIVPTASESWLPHDFIEQATAAGAVLVRDCQTREDYLTAIADRTDLPTDLDAERVADVSALGLGWLYIELLTQRMHYMSAVGEDLLERSALAAATCIVEHRGEDAGEFLATGFDALTNAREQFHGVQCFLLDIVLLTPDRASEDVAHLLEAGHPVNLLLTGQDLDRIAETDPQTITDLKTAWEAGRIDLLGGEQCGLAPPMTDTNDWLADFEWGRERFRHHFGRVPRTWARTTFGLTSLMPGVLDSFGYHTALHVVMDPFGAYPDQEDGKVRWEGCGSAEIDAITRFPLVADAATNYLRLPEQLADAIGSDQVASLCLARHAKTLTPFLSDVQRMAGYSPVLGKLVTFEDFHADSDETGHFHRFDESEYFSMTLTRLTVAKQPDPISRVRSRFERGHNLDAASLLDGLTRAMRGGSVRNEALEQLRRRNVEAGFDTADDESTSLTNDIGSALRSAAETLANLITTGGNDTPGVMLMNPHGHPRRVTVPLPQPIRIEADDDAVQAMTSEAGSHWVTLNLPSTGFAWFPIASESVTLGEADLNPDEGVLRNEFFEIIVNPETGGIGRLKEHGRKPNRLSTQVAYRFEEERVWTAGDDSRPEEHRSEYSTLVCDSMTLTASNPVFAEIETSSRLLDPANQELLATVRQRVRIFKARRTFEIDLDLEPATLPTAGPWTNYYALRLAWMDITAAVTRTVLGTAQGFRGERIEGAHALEIADSDTRTTIHPRGRAFHRRSGSRMIDSLLLVAGEEQQSFSFAVAVEAAYPMQSALAIEMPVPIVPVAGPPRSSSLGWLLHLTSKNLRLLRLSDLLPIQRRDRFPAEELFDASEEATPQPSEPPSPPGNEFTTGFAVRVQETEGREAAGRLTFIKPPRYARSRDFEGNTLRELTIEANSVRYHIAPYEIVELELRF